MNLKFCKTHEINNAKWTRNEAITKAVPIRFESLATHKRNLKKIAFWTLKVGNF